MKVLSIAGKAELLAWLKLVERQLSPREVAGSGLQTSEATVSLVNVRDWSHQQHKQGWSMCSSNKNKWSVSHWFNGIANSKNGNCPFGLSHLQHVQVRSKESLPVAGQVVD